jgi:hypothetical protein
MTENIFPIAPPKLLKPYVLTFAREVAGPDAAPGFIRCCPVEDAPYNECFALVQAHVEKNGGDMVLGWAIWERPKVLIEAEFHAAWKTSRDELIDIAPRPIPFPRILFLPDARRKDTGFQVDNVRKPLAKDKDIQRFIELYRERFRLLNEGKLKYQFGGIALTDEKARRVAHLDMESACLEERFMRRYWSK